jgi:polyisoprenoid-binding protein YceI
MKRFFHVLSFGLSLVAGNIFAAELKVDSKATQLTWYASKKLGHHYGSVKAKDGKVEVKDGNLVGGKFEVDMDSMAVDPKDTPDTETQGKLIGHLKSDDFFSVASNKTASFEIKSATPWANVPAKDKKAFEKALAETNKRDFTTIKVEQPTHLITGTLTIKGKSHEQSFPAVVKTEKDKVSAQGVMLVDRTKYDVRYGSKTFFKNLGDKYINDQFEVGVNLVAKK